MQKRSLDAGGVTLAIILGLLSGPLIFYGLAGDYWHSVALPLNQYLWGAIGGVLGIGALVNASRYRNPGLAGAVSGIAGGIGEVAFAVLPWAAFSATHPKCDPNNICPLGSTDLGQLALRAGAFSLIVFTLAGFSLALLIAAIRGRIASA